MCYAMERKAAGEAAEPVSRRRQEGALDTHTVQDPLIRLGPLGDHTNLNTIVAVVSVSGTEG